jgi:LPXTG-site transpeptidase (sortase) family protein
MMRERQPLDAGSIPGGTEQEVLRWFVSSVRAWRGGSTTTPRFRRADLLVLGDILGTDAERIERRLIELTGCSRATAKLLRRLLLVGVGFLPTAPAALTMVAEGAGPTVSAPMEQVAAASSSRAVEAPVPRPAPPTAEAMGPTSTAKLGPTVQPQVPLAEVPVPGGRAAAPEAPVPEAAPSTQASVTSVSIPRLGIDQVVVDGGQDVIDQGLVAHYWASGWREPAGAGATGTYWLAAHHETHGAPFLHLPDVLVGDRIDVTTGARTFTYSVSSTEIVEDDAGFGPVYGDDPAARVILLQTCIDSVRRLLVHGTLVATS